MDGRRGIQERREGGGRKGNCETGQAYARQTAAVGECGCVGDKQVGSKAELDYLLGLLDETM